MSSTMQKTGVAIVLATLSGMAFGQSDIDLDRAYASQLRSDAQTRSSLLGNTNSANVNVEVPLATATPPWASIHPARRSA